MRPQRPVGVSVFPLVLSFTGAMQLSRSVGKEEEEDEFYAELGRLAAGRRGAATCSLREHRRQTDRWVIYERISLANRCFVLYSATLNKIDDVGDVMVGVIARACSCCPAHPPKGVSGLLFHAQ